MREQVFELCAGQRQLTLLELRPSQLDARTRECRLSSNHSFEREGRIVVLEYTPKNADPEEMKTLALVGKGITFDSGGISIKPSAKMEEMKMDMSGGAAVLEAVAAIAELGLKLNVLAATVVLLGGHAHFLREVQVDERTLFD